MVRDLPVGELRGDSDGRPAARGELVTVGWYVARRPHREHIEAPVLTDVEHAPDAHSHEISHRLPASRRGTHVPDGNSQNSPAARRIEPHLDFGERAEVRFGSCVHGGPMEAAEAREASIGIHVATDTPKSRSLTPQTAARAKHLVIC